MSLQSDNEDLDLEVPKESGITWLLDAGVDSLEECFLGVAPLSVAPVDDALPDAGSFDAALLGVAPRER